jgi:hypothetical protein
MYQNAPTFKSLFIKYFGENPFQTLPLLGSIYQKLFTKKTIFFLKDYCFGMLCNLKNIKVSGLNMDNIIIIFLVSLHSHLITESSPMCDADVTTFTHVVMWLSASVHEYQQPV